MLIVVIGNISAGKTTTCKALAKKLGNYEYVSLDVYRRSNMSMWVSRANAKSNSDKARIDAQQLAFENKAKREFYAKVQLTKNCIVEATGTGKDFNNVFLNRNVSERLVVKLKCSVNECIIRSKDKINTGYEWPLLPEVYKDYSGLTDAPLIKVLENGIIWMHDQLENPHLVKSHIVIDSKVKSTGKIIKEILELGKFG